ncbi:hypothetical protein TNCV_4121131 [Trichonephila clavipes]|nr:hypothetical protein TNCV_4121131 [Trichonephila clavipes]
MLNGARGRKTNRGELGIIEQSGNMEYQGFGLVLAANTKGSLELQKKDSLDKLQSTVKDSLLTSIEKKVIIVKTWIPVLGPLKTLREEGLMLAQSDKTQNPQVCELQKF